MTKLKMEVRFNSVELDSTGDDLVVTGYANKTNQLSEILGKRKKFREKILPGVFTRAIQRAANDIHMLLSHDDTKVLASTRNKSLIITEDNVGLKVEARISPTTYGRDAYQLVKDGILTNMSFGMVVNKDEWRQSEVPGLYERTITDLNLYEVSIVRDPAYSQTIISARGIDLVDDIVPENINEEDVQMNEQTIKDFGEVVTAFKGVVEEMREVTKELKEERAAQKAEAEAREAEAKAAEEKRKADEAEALAAAEEKRKAEEAAEEKRKAEEAAAEEKRKAEEKELEEKRAVFTDRLKQIKEETHNEEN